MIAFGAFTTSAYAQTEIADGTQITENTTWSGEIILNGLVFVGEETTNADGTETQLPDDRVELTIEPGTVIRGRPGGDGQTPGALIVRRSARIDADGNANNPIIFTSLDDDLSDPFDEFDLSGNPERQQWGGVILLGRATTNQNDGEPLPGGTQIEGIPDEPGTRARFGGTNDNDNTGTFRFVSIRHGGFSISGVPGDEINGLTMGALGRGTTIEFVEVFANFDDGFEWFGGTVHTSHLVSVFNGDDSFDYDQGWRGSGQFWYSLQATDAAGRAGEHDGGDAAGDGAVPFSRPVISNVTYFGSGPTPPQGGGDNNQPAFAIRDNAGGEYYNSIIHDFPGKAATLEDVASGPDTRQRFAQGDLIFENNVFGSFQGGDTFADLVTYTGESTAPVDGFGDGNSLQTPGATIDREIDGEGGNDPRPTADLPDAIAPSAFTANASAEGDVSGFSRGQFLSKFESVDYLGAFSQSDVWINNWTYLDELGEVSVDDAQEIADGTQITENTTWSGEIVLNGLVFVGEETTNADGTETQLPDDRVELTIEPGTVIRGRPGGDGQTPGALIVRRSARIDADGTRSRPIIFTSLDDDLSDPFDEFDLSGNPERQQWGGVILLGRATTNQNDGEPLPGGTQIEGIPDEPGTRARFGGTSDNDNTGTFRFVSIRHGGFSISGVPGDEINGLTMGALGRGTTIEFVEVFANFDDGFEWFGGTVHTSHLVSVFNGDDSFDYDQGWRGSGQFWYSLQATDAAGRAGEHDGGDAAGDGAVPFSRPVISNVTYFGSGPTPPQGGGDNNQPAFAIRDNAGGEYYNSIIHDFPGKAATLEDVASGPDTRQRFAQGDLIFENNVFGSFQGGDTFAELVTYTGESTAPVDGFGDGNTLQDPGVTIDREVDGEGGTDARPTADLPGAMAPSAFTANAAADGDVGGFSRNEYLAAFEGVGYVGAFAPNARQWTRDWTYSDRDLNETLPVELAAFGVDRDGEDVILTWTTASETNNAGFDVQRSVDGGAFQTVGFRKGAGTTEQAQTYRFTDTSVPFEASSVRYRLRQQDLDGTVEFSPVRTVTVAAPQQVTLRAPFPNPAPQQATIRYQLPKDGDVELSLYNVLGQRVATLVRGQQSAGNKQYTVDTSTLGSGMYFVRLQAQGQTFTERLTVVK